MATVVDKLMSKMGLSDEPSVLSKTNELIRLLELRSVNVRLQINEYAKIILCAEIAASAVGVVIFDREQALKLSGLRKTHYMKHKRMVEKLLDLNRVIGIHDICIQLNLNEVAKKANELLDLYKDVIASRNPDIDVSHPQYAAMAVFYACKMINGKASKPKLLPFSNLRPTQWLQLEQHWAKFMSTHYKNTMDNKLVNQATETTLRESVHANAKDRKACNRPEVEDYEKWKSRMLEMATAKLKELKDEETEDIEKENFLDRT